MKIAEQPSWKVDIDKLPLSKLEENLTCDVAVIGGGLAGILTAYRLALQDKKVIVLEKKQIGHGATEYTTAFLTAAIDTDTEELVSMFGEDKTRLVWQSGEDAINLIESIVSDEHIDCDFMRTSLFEFARSAKDFELLHKEYQSAASLGVDITPPIKNDKFNFRNYGYLELKNQAKFHPLKFLYTLADKARKLGVQIYEQSEVDQIKHEKEKVTLKIGQNTVEAKKVVVATYQPFHNRIRLFLKRGMYKSFVIEAKISKNLIPVGLYLDTDNPYHYFRVDGQENFDRMILGGADIKTIFKINSEKSFNALEEYLHEILPGQNVEIVRRWIGPILEPSDGLALIGQTFDREFVATAFSGNGMTYSAISAMIISDLVLGRTNIYAELYDPKRIPNLKQLFLKGSDYVEEFLGGAAKNMFKSKQPSST